MKRRNFEEGRPPATTLPEPESSGRLPMWRTWVSALGPAYGCQCPKVAAVGHDCTISASGRACGVWLNPDPSNLAALYAIFDDKRHLYHEHRLAA